MVNDVCMTLHYQIHEIVPYINWVYFFHAWGFPPRFAAIADIHGCDVCRATWLASFPVEDRARAAEAMQLHKEALRMLTLLDSRLYRAHVRFGLFPCNSDGEDIIVHSDSECIVHSDSECIVHSAEVHSDTFAGGNPESQQSLCTMHSGTMHLKDTMHSSTLSFLRQQTAPFLCLADFIRPLNQEGITDRIGIFAASADAAIEHAFEGEDDYRHLLCQTLADRLAEAATERAHEAIRRIYWGYAAGEELSIADLHAERFRGIRPAVGYPSLPDQSLNFDLDRLIDFSAIGITLTEHGAMRPHASVSGLMLAHPDAHYFSIGRIGEDQLLDYAHRKGRTPEEMRPYLAANL